MPGESTGRLIGSATTQAKETGARQVLGAVVFGLVGAFMIAKSEEIGSDRSAGPRKELIASG